MSYLSHLFTAMLKTLVKHCIFHSYCAALPFTYSQTHYRFVVCIIIFFTMTLTYNITSQSESANTSRPLLAPQTLTLAACSPSARAGPSYVDLFCVRTFGKTKRSVKQHDDTRSTNTARQSVCLYFGKGPETHDWLLHIFSKRCH